MSSRYLEQEAAGVRGSRSGRQKERELGGVGGSGRGRQWKWGRQ